MSDAGGAVEFEKVKDEGVSEDDLNSDVSIHTPSQKRNRKIIYAEDNENLKLKQLFICG